MEALLERRADAAFVRVGVLEDMVRAGTLRRDAVRVIHPVSLPGYPFALSTTLYPPPVVGVLPGMEVSGVQALTAALLEISQGPRQMRELGIYGFTLPPDLAPVAAAARELRVEPFQVEEPVTFAAV